MPDEKTMLAADCKLHDQVVAHQLSRKWANFLQQKWIAGLVKHLSPCTGLISVWMTLALTPFGHKKLVWDAVPCGILSTAMSLS